MSDQPADESLPLVSVCMVTYNHGPFIAQAIEGVMMQQTSFRVELIIGEDCSTDNTRSVCIQHQQKYPEKITLLLPEKNRGMMNNFLDILHTCKGKYIAICDGDDFWTDPQKLQQQVDFLEANPGYMLHFTNANGVDEKGNIVTHALVHHTKNDFDIDDFLQPDNPARTLTSVFRVPENIQYEDILGYPYGDIPLWVLLMNRFGAKCRYEDKITASYRYHGSGVFSMKKSIQTLRDMILLFEKFNRKYPQHRETIEHTLLLLQDKLLKEIIAAKQKKNFILTFLRYRLQGRTLLSVRDAIYLIRHA